MGTSAAEENGVPYTSPNDVRLRTTSVTSTKTQEEKWKEELKSITSVTSRMELPKEVGLMGGISIIVGTIIGSGIFISPKGIAEGSGSVGLSLIIWLVCGLISMCGALSMCELGTLIPESGGEHAYLMSAFGPAMAFLFDWTFALLIKPSSLAIVTLTCAEYLTVPFFNDDCGSPPEVPTKLLAITVILLLIAVNCYSVILATQIQIIFTWLKVIALIIIIIGGIVRLFQGHTEHLATGFENTETHVGTIVLGAYSGMWAYNGWNNLNYVTEELQDPVKNLPRSILIGVPLVIILYLCVNVSYFTVMSIDELLASPAVAITWAEVVIPTFWWTMPIFVAASTFGGGNGNLLTTARICFAAARDGHFMQVLSYVHVEAVTPVPSVIMVGILGICYVIPSDVGSLIDLFNFATWFFYGCGMSALLVMRYTKRKVHRPYKVNISIPIIVLIAAIILVLIPFIDDPKVEFIYAICFIVGGLIFYFPFVYFKYYPPCMEYFTCFFQLYLKVVPTAFDQIMKQRGGEINEQTIDVKNPEQNMSGELDTTSEENTGIENKGLDQSETEDHHVVFRSKEEEATRAVSSVYDSIVPDGNMYENMDNTNEHDDYTSL